MAYCALLVLMVPTNCRPHRQDIYLSPSCRSKLNAWMKRSIVIICNLLGLDHWFTCEQIGKKIFFFKTFTPKSVSMFCGCFVSRKKNCFTLVFLVQKLDQVQVDLVQHLCHSVVRRHSMILQKHFPETANKPHWHQRMSLLSHLT